MNNVLVLMSTYNGEKYISEQIDSILNQKDVDVYLQIRDDGSTDKTIEIIKSFVEKNDNINLIQGENVGWKKSFMSLVENVNPDKNDFYAFSDQDDVWLDDKLVSGIEKIKEFSEVSSVYHSNVTIVNNSMENLGNRFPHDFKPSDKLPNYFFDGLGVGATMIFNKKMVELVKKHVVTDEINHDAYIMALGYIFGKVIYDKDSHINYRRHENTATGFGKNASGNNEPSLLMRYKRYRKGPKNNFSKRANQIILGYSDQMTDTEREFFNDVANYMNDSKIKLKLLFSPKYSATGMRKTLQVKYRAMFNTL